MHHMAGLLLVRRMKLSDLKRLSALRKPCYRPSKSWIPTAAGGRQVVRVSWRDIEEVTEG
jgi:hypothetical protein